MHAAARAYQRKGEGGFGAWLPAVALLVLSLPLLLLSRSPISTSKALVIFRPGISARNAFLLATGAGASVIGQGGLSNCVIVAPGADTASLREAGALLIIAASGLLCGSQEGTVR